MSKQRRTREGREAERPAREGKANAPDIAEEAAGDPNDQAEGAGPELDGTDPADRRSCPRAPIEAEISLTSEHNLYAGIANDISEGGVFVATYQPLPVGTAVAIELSFESIGGPRVLVNGEVRWHRGDGVTSRAAPGMGLRFLDLQDDFRAWIADFVRQREPEFFEETPETAGSRRVLPTAELAAAASRGSGAAAHSKLLFSLGLVGLLGLVGAVAMTMLRGPAVPPPRAAARATQEEGGTPTLARAAEGDRQGRAGAKTEPGASTAQGAKATSLEVAESAAKVAAPAKAAEPAKVVEPAAKVAAPAKVTAPAKPAKATDPGLVVAAHLRPCFKPISKAVDLKVALYVESAGRVVRGFVTGLRGTVLAASVVSCARERVRGLQLPLTLPRADFVEWRLTLEPTEARATLVKPRRLAP
ncbi:MAG: PilZ domain-containing protein [Proteobacteria bacterium]|nr:PilZ domain-containing protein [Pseudomonadota bacterium]